VAAGNAIDLQGDTLRTDGLITANQVTAIASQVYGNVEAVSVSGSTFAGTTSQVDSAKLPTMPNWATVFDYYRANATTIFFGSLPTASSINLIGNHNPSVEGGTIYWTGTQPGAPSLTATVSQSTAWKHQGSRRLRVSSRSSWQAGAIYPIQHFVRPGQQYDVGVWANPIEAALIGLGSRTFQLTMHVKGTNDASELVVATSPFAATWVTVVLTIVLTPAQITGQLTVPAWSGDLEYAFVKVSDASSSGGTDEFFVDDLSIREVGTGRRIFRRVLGPGPGGNPFGTPNPEGIYKIDCGGQQLTIDRSCILGTLLLINPGPNSGVTDGPIHWAPAVAGYPALLVDADNPSALQFSIRSSNQVLSEADQRVNYNPAGAPHEQFGSDTELNDIYPSVIRGMVAVEGDFAFQNRPYLLGQLLVGRSITNSTGELDVEYQADSLLNPPPGFLAPYTHSRRPGSVQKAVLP
jgi:hypothetical protein